MELLTFIFKNPLVIAHWILWDLDNVEPCVRSDKLISKVDVHITVRQAMLSKPEYRISHKAASTIIAPTLLIGVGTGSDSIPDTDAISNEVYRRVDIRVPPSRRLRSRLLNFFGRSRFTTGRIALKLIHDQLANMAPVAFEPLRLTDSGILLASGFTLSQLSREIPIHGIHVPPLGCEDEDRPDDDPEESEVEDPAYPGRAPLVDNMGPVDVDRLLIHAESDVDMPAVLCGAYEAFEIAFQRAKVQAVDFTLDAEDLEFGR